MGGSHYYTMENTPFADAPRRTITLEENLRFIDGEPKIITPKKPTKYVKRTIVFIILICLYLGTEVGIGIYGKGECSSYPIDLGTWMIVAGTVGIVSSFIVLVPKLEVTCSCCVFLFDFSWFIVGGFCLFSNAGSTACATPAIWGWALFFWIMNVVFVGTSKCFYCIYKAFMDVLAISTWYCSAD